jgi:pSer/pThr/pTyr-binding forkhead associated (FHA) protein
VIYEEEGEGKGTVFELFELSASRILIGSSYDNELVLDTPDIDAGHASLELRHDRWVLQDLGSGRGTRVNAKSINGPHYLQHNDLIEIGGIKLQFQETDANTETAKVEDVEEEDENIQEQAGAGEGPHLSGRVWFATIAGTTVAVIFIILLLLIVADYLDLLQIADLLPPWL